MSSRSDSTPAPVPHEKSALLRELFGAKVLVADGAMGTMLQAADPTLDDFQGYEGCNEILNVTRPDIVRSVHEEYLAVGVDMIETNTFGANFANLAEYDIPERTYELAEAGARIAAEAAAAYSTEDQPRFVLGSMGPGTKLPSLEHETYDKLRDYYQQAARGLIDGGADAILIETAQDLLQVKAAVVGSKRARSEADSHVPIIAQVTIETTGTMLMGSEIGAALTSLETLGIDMIGLNCATGPAEMSEHLRYLAQHSRIPISVMPNAGLPQLGKNGATYPLQPHELAEAHQRFTRDFGVSVVGGCCGTTPAHLAAVVEAVGGHPITPRTPLDEPSVASLYAPVTLQQDTSYLSIGERTNANGSKAFREAMLAADWDACIEIAKAQTRDGAHLLDLCVDYVGRDGVADMHTLAAKLATSSTLPIMLDSTEPAVIEAGLVHLGGRAAINSVNYEDGDGPQSRFTRMMQLAKEHGAAVVALTIDEQGQARTAEDKVRIASRLVDTMTGPDWGLRVEDIIVDCLTFPIATGQEETRRDAIETLEAIKAINAKYPGINTTLGVSNVSFGLKAAARQVLNSVFLAEAVKNGLSSAIVNSAKILPTSRIEPDQLKVAMDMIYDRRERDESGEVTYDPLSTMLELFEGVDSASLKEARAEEMAALPLAERLQRRIVDGERNGLELDLDEAIAEGRKALDVINEDLLEGMKVVGELFGSGRMQLPFVLQSAETMKAAVAHLEPTIEKQEAEAGNAGGSRAKAKIVLATVKGDVHDIGKNLVDIILSNNGFDVVNIGIKMPVNEIISAAEEHEVDAIGMSGLLVKSTVVMKDNLEELNTRGLGERFPVLLGGAALTRVFVEQDLGDIYDGEVRYAKDAFEGLRLMENIAEAKKTGVPISEVFPARRERRVRTGVATAIEEGATTEDTARSNVTEDNEIPTPPFWGTRIVKGIPLADYAAYLDERATFLGQWGLKPTRNAAEDPAEDRTSIPARDYEELVETEGRPRLRMWLDRIREQEIMRPAVVYGYFPCYSEANDLVVLWESDGEHVAGTARLAPLPGAENASMEPHRKGEERLRFTFPRQRRDRRLNLADFFRSKEKYEADGRPDVLAFQLVTMGSHVSDVTAGIYQQNAYRDYLELHGLSVQLTEALAEMWHSRVRAELGFPDDRELDLDDVLDVRFRGCRYSFGYPACPDIEDRDGMVALLEPERIGVELSEEYQLHPEQSTDALITHHPEAKYFKV